MCGALVWLFAFGLALARVQFGYFDARSAAMMALILIPPLALAIGVLLRLDATERENGRSTEPKATRASDAAKVTVTSRRAKPVVNRVDEEEGSAFYVVTGVAMALMVLAAVGSLCLVGYLVVTAGSAL